MRLGAPIFEQSRDPEDLANAHAKLGYRAGFCPWSLSPDDTAYLGVLRQAFAARDVAIAEVVGWRNLIPADSDMRAEAFTWVCGQLAVAEELGAGCCVTFGGTLDNVTSWTVHPGNLTPETFDLIVDTVRQLIDTIKPRRTRLALEMMASVYPDSAETYLALIKAVDRPAFGVHFDPVNIILTRRDYFANGPFIRACVEALGPWIVSCHAKDVVWRPERGFHFYECIPGTGVLDFAAYLSAIRSLPPDLPLLLEHLNSPEDYRQGFAYLAALADGQCSAPRPV